MVAVKFLVFVSEVVSIFSKILTLIVGGERVYLCPTNSIIGGACPGCPPKSTPMYRHNCISAVVSETQSTVFFCLAINSASLCLPVCRSLSFFNYFLPLCLSWYLFLFLYLFFVYLSFSNLLCY